MARVSIITPLYNAGATLAEALDSVYAQDFTDWELILFDDGSGDETGTVARNAVAARPGQIHYFEHTDGRNHGPAAARNRAVERAGGELVAFLDADDLWLPGKLTEHVRWLNSQSDAAMVWGPAEYFGDAIESYKQVTGIGGDQVRFEAPALVKTFIREVKGTPCPSGVLLRKKAFLDVGGFEEALRRGEDISLWVKIGARHAILYDDRIWFRYRRHQDSSTSRSGREMTREQWELDFSEWLLNFVYCNADLIGLRAEVEALYHATLQNWARRWGWWRSRLQVSRGLSHYPGLLGRRWWCLLPDWVLPFDVSRRVVGKIQSWTRPWGHR